VKLHCSRTVGEVLLLVACVGSNVCLFVCNDVCNVAALEETVTVVIIEAIRTDRQRLCYHAIKFARWQHPITERGARIAAPGTIYYLLFYLHLLLLTNVIAYFV